MGVSYEQAAQAQGGLSYDDATAAYTPPPSLARSAADWATSAIRGLAKGSLGMLALPGDVGALAQEKLGIPDARQKVGKVRPEAHVPTSAELTSEIGGSAGKFLQGKPETTGGRYAESIGEFAPGMAGGGGGLLRKGIQAVAGGVGSEKAGELAKEYLPDHETASRVIGGIFGQGLPAMVRRGVAPSTISPTREAMGNTLRQEGVDTLAGDLSGSRTLKYAEHGLGDAPGSGGAYSTAKERQGEQYTRAILRRVGENADRAEPEVVDRAFRRIGNDFDTLSARNSARLDNQYLNDVAQAQLEYDHLFADPLRRPLVQNVVDHAFNQLRQSRTMTGEQYQALRSRIERMRRGNAKDPELSDFLGEVRRSMDDLMERNIRQNNPQDLGAWQQARRQYRNMLTVEKAATGAGETAAGGIISPAKLRQALVSQSRRGYARGQGDFAELARAGEGLLKPPPTSGTAERAWMHAIPAALGAGLGEMAGGNMLALPAAMAGVAAPGVAGRALMTPAVQGYLKNQIARSLGINPTALDALTPGKLDALVRSALAGRAASSGQGQGSQATD